MQIYHFKMTMPSFCNKKILLVTKNVTYPFVGVLVQTSPKAANMLNRWWSERSERNLRIGYLLTPTLVLEEGEHK